MSARQILVRGYGSIGKRHVRLLAEAGHEPVVVSRQAVAEHPSFPDLAAALQGGGEDFALILLASETVRHGEDLAELVRLGVRRPVLVEKPLLHRPSSAPPPPFPTHVAYNLRFHAVVEALRRALRGRRLLTASLTAGQHLAQWRPGRDPKESYSAYRAQGGGVTRDLSHELDLAQHLFGPARLLAGHSARVGEVTVDSEDVALAVLAARDCPFVSVHVDYLDPEPRRRIRILTETGAIEADLLRGLLSVDGRGEKIPLPPDHTYRRMHAAALGDGADLCGWDEGLAVVELAEKIAPQT